MARVAALFVVLVVMVLVPALQPGLAGQVWQTPRTSWGHADLSGTWSTATITPLERPAELAGKASFTAAEAADYERVVVERTNRDQRPDDAAADVARAYNDFWWDSGTRVVPTRRTSLVVDPPDGRVPALTTAAQQRQAALAEARQLRGPADHPEDRNLWERCLTRGLPTAMLPQVYNNNYQIVQTTDHVVILAEMIHDARVIPLDGRPHLPAHLRAWMGDSVGRWDGDTLVIDTTNSNGMALMNVDMKDFASPGLHVVERITLIDLDQLYYEVTLEDPAVYTRPWTMAWARTRWPGRHVELLEDACVEGNRSNTLSVPNLMFLGLPEAASGGRRPN